jgi:kinesin family member 22
MVEIEVTRRLREKEQEDEERRKKEEEQRADASNSSLSRSPSKRDRDHSLPSGVLTPLLQKHKDLDDELRTRLQELERKLCVPCVQSPTDFNLSSGSVATRSSN